MQTKPEPVDSFNLFNDLMLIQFCFVCFATVLFIEAARLYTENDSL